MKIIVSNIFIKISQKILTIIKKERKKNFMVSERFLSFLAKIPEKFSANITGFMLNILFILIIIVIIWGLFEIEDKFSDGGSVNILDIVVVFSFFIGFVIILILIVDIIATLFK